jgi:Zn-dependent protease with chaperone function
MLHPGRLWEPEQGLLAYPMLLSNLFLLGLAQLAYGAALVLAVFALRTSQRAEYLADDLAARVAGVGAKRDLLTALQAADVANLALQQLALARGEHSLTARLEQAMHEIPQRERERLRRVGRLEQACIDASHPPTALRLAMLDRRADAPPLVVLSEAEHAAINRELRELEGPIQQQLIAAYRSGLYAG